MKILNIVAMTLLVVGGLNWGLVGIGVGDVVINLGGTVAMIVYILVGLSAIYVAVTCLSKKCCCCASDGVAAGVTQ